MTLYFFVYPNWLMLHLPILISEHRQGPYQHRHQYQYRIGIGIDIGVGVGMGISMRGGIEALSAIIRWQHLAAFEILWPNLAASLA